jgi:hypothetical protein
LTNGGVLVAVEGTASEVEGVLAGDVIGGPWAVVCGVARCYPVGGGSPRVRAFADLALSPASDREVAPRA